MRYLLILALIVAGCGPVGDTGFNGDNAYGASKNFVNSRLVAPADAEYPEKYTFTDKGGDTCLITAYVDAKNPLGVRIRHDYVAKMYYKGNDQWHLVALMMP